MDLYSISISRQQYKNGSKIIESLMVVDVYTGLMIITAVLPDFVNFGR